MTSHRTAARVSLCSLCVLVAAACSDGKDPMVVGEVAGAIDLKGVWASMDFKCGNTMRRETVLVDVVSGNLKATKVEGDECVPSGFVVIEGKLPKPSLLESELPVSFTFKLYDGVPPSMALAESGTGKVMTPDLIVLTLAETQLRLTRVVQGGTTTSSEDDDELRAGAGGRGAAAGRGARAGSGGSTSSGTDGAGKRGTGSAGRAGSASGDDTDSDTASGARDAGAADAASGDDDTSGEAGGSGNSAGASGRSGAGGRSGRGGRGAAGGSGGSAGSEGDSAGTAGGGAGGRSAADCPGPILKGATCDQVAQCGCQAGESCRFDGAKPPSCFPAGKVKEGYPCKADSECVAGSVCVEELGLCYRQCRETSDCGADGSCLAITIAGAEVEGFGICLDRCEPVLDESCYEPGGASSIECNACVSGAACVPLEGVPTTGCVKAKTTTQKSIGQSCSEHSECAGGGCLNGECRAWCRTDADCVQFGSSCLGDIGYFKSEGDEIGLCDSTDDSGKPDGGR